MHSYQDISKYDINDDGYKNSNIVVCINSLLLLNEWDFKNSIVYIDEINSFIESMVANETLKQLNLIYHLLVKIIRNAHTVVVSDATITNNVFKFLKYRSDANKIFINNTFKRNSNIDAI